MQYLTIWDLILTPVFLIVLIAIAKKQRERWYPVGHPLRKYYLPGLLLKFGGAIFIALIYQFYYGGGDTFNFFRHAQVINSSFSESFSTWIKLLTRQSYIDSPEVYPYMVKLYWYNDPSSYAVGAIAAVFGILCGTTYIPIALLFAYFSFTGVWAMYRTFTKIYPKLHKQLAIGFLFIPSTFVWGSAVFKDTICMFALGWMTYTTFRVFVNRDLSFRNLFLLALSFYLVFLIKIYILLAFVPALMIWLLTTYSGQIRVPALRVITKIIFISLAVVGFFFFTQKFAEELNKYSLENIAKTATITREYLAGVSEKQEGSGYDLGNFEPTIGGMLSKFPQAVVVTLFRPFPWEAGKVIIMLSALEALVFIYFTIQAFRKRGLWRGFSTIFKDSNLFFCFLFSIIFSFAVGISSYNFGTLSRYKIPCLPFYFTMLMVLLYKDNEEEKTTTAYQKELPKYQPAI